MSDASREKEQGDAPRSGGAEQATRSNPGRGSLTSGLDDGDGLPYRQRSLFEASLGRDLSGVRVHTGDAASEQASQHNARAFAVGNDIVFGAGQYNPGTKDGDALLAHEVAHTAQQGGGAAPDGKLATTSPGDRAEKGADAATGAMLAGKPATVEAQPVSIARKMMDERVDAPSSDGPMNGDGGGGGGGDEGGLAGGSGASTQTAGAKEGEDAGGGDFSVSRVGQEEEEGTEPVGPPQDLEGGKNELAAKGAAAKGEGGGSEPGDFKPEGMGGGKAGGDAGGGDVGAGGGEMAPPSPEMVAAMAGAQNDAREGQAAADTESAAFKSEMQAKRDQFDAEQQALTTEKLRSMSPADKRSTLIEMGWDQKKVKKLKDSELDAIIEGKFAAEARKSKIMGMTPEELAALSPGQKIQHLVDLGVDKEDLDKIGQAKACAAFDEVMRLAHVPGQHKVKIKIKGGFLNKKEWHLSINCDAEGNTDIQAKKEGGFLSKLWGWVKALLPIILTVLGPITGGISLIVLAVYQTAIAIQTGDWLGAVIGIAGAFVGVGAYMAMANIAKGAYGTAITFLKIANIATKVQKVAQAAQAAMLAAKAKNAGSLLGALASGAAGFASFAANAAGKFATTMTAWSERLKKWSAIINGGQKVVQGIKSNDPIAAIGGAFETASAVAGSKTQTGKNLTRAANITGFVNTGRRALQSNPPNYAVVAEAALGIAGQLTQDRRFDDAGRIVGAADRLKQAWAMRETNPAGVAEAALLLAQAIQVAKYDSENEEKKDKDGNPVQDEQRDAIFQRYTRATNIVRAADTLVRAASAKPRPNYMAALDAATQLVAELTESKRIDAAADISRSLNAWTTAINSKDDKAIMQAAIELGNSINGLRDVIKQEREDAKKEAEAKLGEGETLPESGGDISQFDGAGVEQPAGETPVAEPAIDPETGAVETTPDGTTPGTPGPTTPGPTTPGPVQPALNPRGNTPDSNYEVIPNDTLSGIAGRFKTSVSTLRSRNPQLVSDRIYVGQKIFVPGADILLTPSITYDERYSIDPAVLARANLEELKDAGYRMVDIQFGRINHWRESSKSWWMGGFGAIFYHKIDVFGRDVAAFRQRLTSPTITAESIRSGIHLLAEKAEPIQQEYDQKMRQRESILGGAQVGAEVVKTGCGIVISAFGTPAAAAGYHGATGFLDSWLRGDPPDVIAVKTAAGAAFEAWAPLKGATPVKKFLAETVNQAFQSTGSALADLYAELRTKKDLTTKEKRAIVARYATRISVHVATSPFAGAIGGNEDVLKDLEKNLLKLMSESFDVAVQKIFEP